MHVWKSALLSHVHSNSGDDVSQNLFWAPSNEYLSYFKPKSALQLGGNAVTRAAHTLLPKVWCATFHAECYDGNRPLSSPVTILYNRCLWSKFDFNLQVAESSGKTVRVIRSNARLSPKQIRFARNKSAGTKKRATTTSGNWFAWPEETAKGFLARGPDSPRRRLSAGSAADWKLSAPPLCVCPLHLMTQHCPQISDWPVRISGQIPTPNNSLLTYFGETRAGAFRFFWPVEGEIFTPDIVRW